MTDATIDVVIPVWNRPSETRNCLVNLINHTPQARLIMFDFGSERDTERLLQEFADQLDDRALLMRDDANIGFVRAANRGLNRSEAPYLALVRNTTQVCQGWLEPLLNFAAARPEAGIMVPCLTTGETWCRGPVEVESASFAATVITRRLYQEIGGFDEGLDGGLWCLRDYTRRACAKGFLSYQVPGPALSYQEEVQLGSERRRQETLEHTLELFRERWGEGRSYAVHVPKGADLDILTEKLAWLVKGARHGDSYFVLLPAALHKTAEQAGLDLLHENVVLMPLPRLALEPVRRRVYQRILEKNPGAVAVSAIDGIAFPWSASFLSFSELCHRIEASYS
jgi:GT2 family glycosyltransferase